MAMQSPFFGKQSRDGEPLQPRAPGHVLGGHANTNAHPANAASAPGAAAGASSVAASASTGAQQAGSVTKEPGSKLTVGPNIKLKGVEITDCDTLVVEGTVEATMDSRVMQISECGAFRGSAEIDIAEIHGLFDGNLTVRQKLVIHTTGKVTGKIRYGKVVIEEGGQLAGDIEFTQASTRQPAQRPTGIQAAA